MKFLLVLLVLWLFGRYVVPLLMRIILRHLLKKQAQRFGQPFGGSPFAGQPHARNGQPPTGEVQVEYVPPRSTPRKPTEFKGGEYVEFEEVK
ncbi:DUF4834 family protein [Hymenobacter metallilatus]|uniref:DUF4834 family protein n=1 Tax=Hymenobacter metallilatus TaxID=2493666 RepID=A0A428JDJ9_9BACT|nr:DUF4834 family protein [Hymenobacter metallilatus]RSK30177.1 DUF4834 family protein [Hymenobacter metallilatus]